MFLELWSSSTPWSFVLWVSCASGTTASSLLQVRFHLLKATVYIAWLSTFYVVFQLSWVQTFQRNNQSLCGNRCITKATTTNLTSWQTTRIPTVHDGLPKKWLNEPSDCNFLISQQSFKHILNGLCFIGSTSWRQYHSSRRNPAPKENSMCKRRASQTTVVTSTLLRQLSCCESEVHCILFKVKNELSILFVSLWQFNDSRSVRGYM